MRASVRQRVLRLERLLVRGRCPACGEELGEVTLIVGAAPFASEPAAINTNGKGCPHCGSGMTYRLSFSGRASQSKALGEHAARDS